jgi:hypothetical protein
MSIELINKAIKESKKKFACENVDQSDVKSRAKILKATFTDLAFKTNINLD